MNKVLIITTHFAPDSHVGAKRPTKFAKFLPEFGWQPVILTQEIKEYHGIDRSLTVDSSDGLRIYRPRMWRMNGNAPPANPSIGYKENPQQNDKQINLVKRIIGRLMLYDFRWLLPACHNGIRIAKEEGVDLLFSTSPNSEAHLVGLWLKMVTGLPWVADFRDPWTALHTFYKPGFSKRAVDRLCERIVLANADYITAISQTLSESLRTLRCPRKTDNISLIYNGYDQEDFPEIEANQPNFKRRFTVTYLGTWGTGRSPESFLRAVGGLLDEHPEFRDRIRVNFVGEVKFDPQMKLKIGQLISEEKLSGSVKLIPFLPHGEALNLLNNSHVSLLVQSRFHSQVGCLSSKLFEYLYVGKPILALAASESEEAQIIETFSAGEVVPPDDVPAIRKKFEQMFVAYQNGKLPGSKTHAFQIEKFERRKLTKNLTDLFREVVSARKPRRNFGTVSNNGC